MKYQVSLPSRPPGGVAAGARAMADAFGISEHKAIALLERTPGPITKPIGEREAVRVAYKLRRLGLSADIAPIETDDDVVATPSDAASAAHGSDERAAPGEASARPRSPFLSQVDDAPPPIPGLDDDERLGRSRTPAPDVDAHADADADADAAADAKTGAGASQQPDAGELDPAATGAAARREPPPRAKAGSPMRVPAPYAPTGVAAAPRTRPVPSPVRRRVALAALLPGIIALLAAWTVFAFVDDGVSDTTLAGIAASNAESFGVLIGGRDPAGLGVSAELREALLASRDALEARGIDLFVAVSLEGGVLAGWSAGRDAATLGPAVTGWTGMVARAQGSAEPVLGTLTADRAWSVAAAPVRVRGDPIAAVMVGADPTPALGHVGSALAAGFFALLLSVAAVILANRSWFRDHDRLLTETVRISRGDLGRPVEPSSRFPETVQALERIRISLLEGLERLRRRKR